MSVTPEQLRKLFSALGRKGGHARKRALTKKRLREIAMMGVAARRAKKKNGKT